MPERPSGRSDPERGWRFALFSEAFFVGVFVAVASLVVVTAIATLSAGTAHLRRHLSGQPTSFPQLLRETLAITRGSWWLSLAAATFMTLVFLNVRLAGAGVLAAGPAVATLSVVAGGVLVVVVLRVAAAWSDGAGTVNVEPRTREVIRQGMDRTSSDPHGSLLLVVAAGMCALFVWMLLPLVLVVGGLLCLAVASVEHRYANTHPRE